MGCNCGGGTRTRAVGTNPSMPMVFGTDDPNLPVRRVSLIEASAGIPAGASRYVRGSEVDSMIVNGKLKILDGK